LPPCADADDVDGWQPSEDAVVNDAVSETGVQCAAVRYCSAVLASAHHHAELVLDALMHVQPFWQGQGAF